MTPKKFEGREPTLSPDDVDKILEFIKPSPDNRRLTFLERESGLIRYLNVRERVTEKELHIRGLKRHPTHQKPPFSLETRKKRKEWVEAHHYETIDGWESIL